MPRGRLVVPTGQCWYPFSEGSQERKLIIAHFKLVIIIGQAGTPAFNTVEWCPFRAQMAVKWPILGYINGDIRVQTRAI